MLGFWKGGRLRQAVDRRRQVQQPEHPAEPARRAHLRAPLLDLHVVRLALAAGQKGVALSDELATSGDQQAEG